MNEVKILETELRSWVLRQPSAKVKQRIFGPGAVEEVSQEAGRRSGLPLWSLLAPVAACLFVAMAALNQHETLFPSGSGTFYGATIASNQSYTVSSSNTFDWTNKADIPSSVRSQSMFGTNK